MIGRRDMLALGAAVAAGSGSAAEPPAGSDGEAAWREYLEALEYARAKMLNSTRCRDAGDRTRALYDVQMLSTVGFNMYMAPRRAHPNFYIHPIFMPFEMTWGQPCPDFLYRWAVLSGRNTYRIWGQVGDAPFLDIQVMDGFWGDPSSSNVANVFPGEHADSQGRFEIFLSPDPQPGKTWVAIPRETRNVVLNSREAWWDWEHDRGAKMQIEAVTVVDPEAEWTYTEAEFNRRLREQARWVRANADFNISMIDHIQAKAGGVNVFAIEWDKDLRLGGKDMGGNPKALKGRMVFDIAPDEALVVEVEAPRAAYWSYSIGDIWYQTPDYSYHQSSLNGHQTSVDRDGRVRYVMAQQDPGAPNWIDLVGLTQGFVNFRFYDPKGGYTPKPVIRKVKFAELRAALPSDTPVIGPQERREQLSRRARASLARYGY